MFASLCTYAGGDAGKCCEGEHLHGKGREGIRRPRCAPHAYLPYLLDDTVAEERALALEFDTKLLKLCTRLVVYGDVISSGMRMEIEEATKLGIPILYRPGICPDERKNNAGTNTAKHRCLHYWI